MLSLIYRGLLTLNGSVPAPAQQVIAVIYPILVPAWFVAHCGWCIGTGI